ncbi:MAG: hypothetical protein P1V20_26490 [Verrucomicrobiales bacterium]|nr:hypothetical protein [Verrucomicrobiales bacterium]
MINAEIDRLFKLDPKGVVRGQRRRILIVQADWELGMARLGQDLKKAGHSVTKVALTTPDLFYRLCGIETVSYRAPLEEFEVWLDDFVATREFDTILIYNPYRPYNRISSQVAERRGLGVVQFDQGLLRPIHVSVFFGSRFPFEQIRELWADRELRGHWPAPKPPAPVRSVSSARKNFWLGFFVLIALVCRSLFPHYRDQQKMCLITQLIGAIMYGVRYYQKHWEPAHYTPKVTGEWSGKYYLVPLQLGHDVQIQHNSPFHGMNEVINLVADSFQRNAGAEDRLVFKIHPLDRGYRTFREIFEELQLRLGEDRVFLVDRVDLTTLIQHSRGVVTVNSTVGLTALRECACVKALGNAFYDLPDLTFQGSLDQFWSADHRPTEENVQQYLNLLECTIQGRGALSARCYAGAGHTGILWPTQVGKTLNLDSFLYPVPQEDDAPVPANKKKQCLI